MLQSRPTRGTTGRSPSRGRRTPPTRGTTGHRPCLRVSWSRVRFNPLQRGELPARLLVSISANAGNYLPQGVQAVLPAAEPRVSIPSNAGELPATHSECWSGSPGAQAFRHHPTRGTTCHDARDYLPRLVDSATSRAATSRRFNPLQRGELPATVTASARVQRLGCTVSILSNAGNYLPPQHRLRKVAGNARVSIASNAGNYLPRNLCSLWRIHIKDVSIPSNAGNYLPPNWESMSLEEILRLQSPPTRGTTCHLDVELTSEEEIGMFQSPPTRGTTCHDGMYVAPDCAD